MQAGRAAEGLRVPRVAVAGGHDARGAGRGGDADAGAEVAEVARVLEQDDGAAGADLERRALRPGHDVAVRAGEQGAHPLRDVGREPLGEVAGIALGGSDHRAEAQCVLERVETLEAEPSHPSSRSSSRSS